MARKTLRELIDQMPEEYRDNGWSWFGQLKWHYMLATNIHGRMFVMGFKRLGMNQAEPIFADRREDEKYSQMRTATSMAIREVPYRDDIVDIDNPFARWIAAASPHAVGEVLDERDRLRHGLRALRPFFADRLYDGIDSPGTRQSYETHLGILDRALHATGEHQWVDARNEVVTSGEMCPECGAVRP